MKIQDASTMPKGAYILTKYTILAEVANESPRTAELLADYGLHCLSCYMSVYDTLESGAKLHGMSDEEIDIMIAEINKELEKEGKNEAVIPTKSEGRMRPFEEGSPLVGEGSI